LAAFHLDKLVDGGLLEAGSRRLTGRSGPGAGRPAKVYRRAAGERGVSVPARDYRTAAGVLAEAAERAGLDAEVQEAARRRGSTGGGRGGGGGRGRRGATGGRRVCGRRGQSGPVWARRCGRGGGGGGVGCAGGAGGAGERRGWRGCCRRAVMSRCGTRAVR